MNKVGGIWSHKIFRLILFEGADEESWWDLEPYNCSRSCQQLSALSPSKESGGKLYGSRSRQLSASALGNPLSSLKKNLAENYVAPDPANILL
jgi:hypothetical protein